MAPTDAPAGWQCDNEFEHPDQVGVRVLEPRRLSGADSVRDGKRHDGTIVRRSRVRPEFTLSVTGLIRHDRAGNSIVLDLVRVDSKASMSPSAIALRTVPKIFGASSR